MDTLLILLAVCFGIFAVCVTCAGTFLFIRWLLIKFGACDISDL